MHRAGAMEVTVLAVAGVLVVVLAAGLTLGLRRRRGGRDPRGDAALAPQRSVWVTPPVPEARQGGQAGGAPKGGHGLIGLEDLPPARRRRVPRALATLALVVVVAGAAVVWNAGFLSSLVSRGTAPGPGSWQHTSAEARAEGPTETRLAPETTTETVEDAAEPVVAEDPVSGTRLIAWSGNGQTGLPGRPLNRALAVLVRDSADRPMPGVEVRFAVAAGGGRLEPAGVVTSDLGLAAASWWLGANADSLRVRVYLADTPGLRVEFEASLRDGAAGPQVAAAAPEDVPERAGAEPEAEVEPVAPPPTVATASRADAGAGDREASASPTGSRPAGVTARARARPAFSAGGVHTCRLVSGSVLCVGGEDGAARGTGRAVGGAPPLRAIHSGVFHSCGLTTAGSVYCWPARSSGQPTAAASGAELRLPGGATPVDVAAGSEHSCALTSDGAVYCWGSNTHGQLGHGGSTSGAPTRVADLPPAVQLVAGWLHTCALTADGRAYCWGANAAGQIGDGGTGDRSRATPVEQAAGFTLITAGSAHTCGLTPAGEAWCWGSNEHGQLGTGTGAREPRPRRAAPDQRFTTVSAGGVHTCGLTGNGQAWCWGRNTFGQLGDGTTRDSRRPARVAGDHRLVSLVAGGAHTCAEAAGGGVYCWGNNMQGQVGDGTRENRSSPVLTMQEGG